VAAGLVGDSDVRSEQAYHTVVHAPIVSMTAAARRNVRTATIATPGFETNGRGDSK
jgi:hypothetical protein